MNITQKIAASFIRLAKPLAENYVPRTYIFLIDLTLSLVAAQCSFFLLSTITGEPYTFFQLKWQLLPIVFIQAVYFMIFKSYCGLVRYSSFKDAIKQLQVTTFCVITVLIINHLYYYTYNSKLILDAGVIIYGFIAFSSLFFFRVVVKKVYQAIHSSRNSSTAYFLGIERSDIALAESLISENSDTFKVIGFIDDSFKTTTTRIFNLPIYSIKQLKKSHTLAKSVIIGDEKLQELSSSKSEILPQLLDLGVKIYKLPNLQDWNQKSYDNLKEIRIEDLLQRSPIKLDNKKLFEIYKDKTILITGAAGSIGSDIVRQLTAFQPKKVILLDQGETPLHDLTIDLDKNYPNIAYEKIIADVRNKNRLRKVFQRFSPEVVFHGAAYKHVPMMESNSIESLSVNFLGTKNLADLAMEYSCNRFVFISTDKAVNPTNVMGASKRAAEIYIQSLSKKEENSTSFITTRFGNVLGSNGSVIPHFKKQIEDKGPVTVTHPKITRYFMTISEACQLVLEAGAMGNGGEIYVFDMGAPIKIIDLAHHMIRLSGLIPGKDIKIEFTGLRPGEKLYEELLTDKETTLPTHHEKILIVQASYSFNQQDISLLTDLFMCIKRDEEIRALKALKMLVPQYTPSINSSRVSAKEETKKVASLNPINSENKTKESANLAS